jgi:hypothetical protein
MQVLGQFISQFNARNEIQFNSDDLWIYEIYPRNDARANTMCDIGAISISISTSLCNT